MIPGSHILPRNASGLLAACILSLGFGTAAQAQAVRPLTVNYPSNVNAGTYLTPTTNTYFSTPGTYAQSAQNVIGDSSSSQATLTLQSAPLLTVTATATNANATGIASNNSFEVGAKAEESLSYYFDIQDTLHPTTSTSVSMVVNAKGTVSGTPAASIGQGYDYGAASTVLTVQPYFDYTINNFAPNGSSPVVYDALTTGNKLGQVSLQTISPKIPYPYVNVASLTGGVPFSSSFNAGGIYTFSTNVEYEVTMLVFADAYFAANFGGTETYSASLDPTFQFAPGTNSNYNLILSAGVGNQPPSGPSGGGSSVPDTANPLALMAASLFAVCLVRRRK